MMNRFIADACFQDFKSDFKRLFERVEKERGELDLRLRSNSFNLYYKGNSLAKVSLTARPRHYSVLIHEDFAAPLLSSDGMKCTDSRFNSPSIQGKYRKFEVPHHLLAPFFRTENLHKIYSRIGASSKTQEIALEQMFITDNLQREDFLVIDRQIESSFFRGRMDVLGLVRVVAGQPHYRFAVLEFKLGNNPELENKVGNQLDDYVDILTRHFTVFKTGYERTYQQMHDIGLLGPSTLPTIEIVEPVEGYVIVGGYSGMAEVALSKLEKKHPHIQIKRMFHRW